MMDLAQERKRLEELDRYGVKTARQWNAYQEEWDRQHPSSARVRKIFGRVFLIIAVILCWLPLILPVVQLMRGMIHG